MTLKKIEFTLEKLFFKFLGADFLALKNGQRREKESVLGTARKQQPLTFVYSK